MKAKNYNTITPFTHLNNNIVLRMPLVLLLDTTSSICKEHSKHLKTILTKIKNDLYKNFLNSDILDICVIGFDNTPRTFQEWCPIWNMSSAETKTNIITNIPSTIKYAVKEIRERKKLYTDLDIKPITPWIIILSDNPSNNIAKIVSIIQSIVAEKEIAFHILDIHHPNKDTYP